MAADEPRARPAARHQHGGRVAAERLGRGLGDRVEVSAQRERLAEQRRDPVEAALDPRLARRSLEALGVPQRERRERRRTPRAARRRRSENVRVASRIPTPSTPRASPPQTIGATSAPREALVGGVRHGSRDRAVALAITGRPRARRRRREPWSGENSNPTSARVEAVHRGAAKHAALGVEQVAVGRVGVEQLGHLLDEPLEHGLELELARHDLRRVQQRAPAARAAAGSRRAGRRCAAPRPSSRCDGARRRSCSPGEQLAIRRRPARRPPTAIETRRRDAARAAARRARRSAPHPARAARGSAGRPRRSAARGPARRRAPPPSGSARARAPPPTASACSSASSSAGNVRFAVGRGEDEHADHALVRRRSAPRRRSAHRPAPRAAG